MLVVGLAVAGLFLAGAAPAPRASPVPGLAVDDASTESAPAGVSRECMAPCAGLGGQLPQLPGSGGIETNAGFTIISPGFNGAEPTIGVDSTGTEVYVQYGLNTVRSLNSGSTWVEIGPAWTNVASLDPMMYYDPVMDRLYANHLTVECTILAWADNPSAVNPALAGTAGWKVNPHACGLPGIDHQKLEGGPSPLLGTANAGRSLYLGYSQAGGGAMVAKSVDGGFTWINALATSSVTRGTVLWPTGPVTTDPAGTFVYLPHHSPTGLRVARSADEGLTYFTAPAWIGPGVTGHAVDPEVGVDDAGNAFVVFYDQVDHQIYYASSTNHGLSWSMRSRISDNTVTLSTVYPTIVAKSPGKFDVAYYGTPSSNAGPDNCAATGPSRCVWYLYMAQVTNATGTPSITYTQVTPNADPVQIGKICTKGTDCAGGTRNLLDFIDIEADGSGSAHIAYTDGCVGSCGAATSGQSTANSGRYARQATGATI